MPLHPRVLLLRPGVTPTNFRSRPWLSDRGGRGAPWGPGRGDLKRGASPHGTSRLDQSDHRGKKRNLPLGKFGQAVLGTRSFASRLPPPPPLPPLLILQWPGPMGEAHVAGPRDGPGRQLRGAVEPRTGTNHSVVGKGGWGWGQRPTTNVCPCDRPPSSGPSNELVSSPPPSPPAPPSARHGPAPRHPQPVISPVACLPQRLYGRCVLRAVLC